MGGAMHEHEYPAQPLKIMVLTLTVENKYQKDLDILGRNITKRKMTILSVYDKQVIERIS